MLPGLSTSDNKDFIALYVGHDPPPCISNGSAPAIDGGFCPVNKTRTIRRQENNGLGNLVRCPDVPWVPEQPVARDLSHLVFLGLLFFIPFSNRDHEIKIGPMGEVRYVRHSVRTVAAE
jgi:hypothetical protein